MMEEYKKEVSIIVDIFNMILNFYTDEFKERLEKSKFKKIFIGGFISDEDKQIPIHKDLWIKRV